VLSNAPGMLREPEQEGNFEKKIKKISEFFLSGFSDYITSKYY